MKKIVIIVVILFSFLNVNSQGNDCSNAIFLTKLTDFCSINSPYSTLAPTSNSITSSSCWPSGINNDVWFKFVSVGTNVFVNIKDGTIPVHSIALYNGTCGSLNQMACSSTSLNPYINLSGLNIGEIYYIRVGSSSANGAFDLCINNSIILPAGADCDLAGKLCNKNTINVSVLNGAGNNSNEGAGTCLDVGLSTIENNSKWYYWTCKSSGTLTFDIKPLNSATDIDFALYQLSSSNPCTDQTVLRCNASSCLNPFNGATGLNFSSTDITEVSGCDVLTQDAYLQYITMSAGTSYALLINNFDGLSGFNIEFGGTGTFQGPEPIITTTNSVLCLGDNIYFDGSNSNSYQGFNWYLPNANPNASSSISTENIIYTTSGIYTAILTATDAIGCVNADYTNITVNDCLSETMNPSLSIPNVFTPNNDHINDLFRVNSTGLKELNVLIFNRWGQKIYTIIGINGSWDGYDCSEGTYYYILSAMDTNDKLIENKGYITLLR